MRILLVHPQHAIQRFGTGVYKKHLRYAPITMPTLAAFITPVGQIVGTNKVVGTAGSTAASIRFWTKGKMDRPVAFVGGAFAAGGAACGALTLAHLDAWRPEEMRIFFGLLLIAIALYMGLKKELGGANEYAGPTRHSP